MVSIEQILYIIPILALTASILYYAINLRNANKTRELQLRAQEQALETRQAALFTQIYNKFGEAEFAKNWSAVMQWEFKDYEEYQAKYSGKVNPEAVGQWGSVARFFHGVGVLVDRDLVDIQLVYDLMADLVIIAWEKMEMVTLTNREKFASPDHGLAFENLYKRLKEMKKT
jgi:hypothetical protein